MRPVPPVTGLDLAFGTAVHLPPWGEIPDAFKTYDNKWNDLAGRWFFRGLPKDTVFIQKPGVDGRAALAACAAILRSWEPKHEHKQAGVGFLMSEWFDRVEIPGEGDVAP